MFTGYRKRTRECLLKGEKIGGKQRADKESKADTHNQMVNYHPGAFGLSIEPEIDLNGSKKHNSTKRFYTFLGIVHPLYEIPTKLPRKFQ